MATVKISFGASATVFTSTALDGLASSSTWIAGFGSAVIDNTSDLYVDTLLAGQFKANNVAPTSGQIQVWVGAVLNDTPTYPDVFTGSAGTFTITTADIRNSIMRQAAGIITDATANRVYAFNPVSVASLFGGVMPNKWWVFVTHSMVQAFNTTSGQGGQCWTTGVNYTVA